MQYAKIDGHSSLVRDLNTGSIVSNDVNEFGAFRQRKEMQARQSARMEELEREVDILKSLLNKLVAKAGIDQC